LDKRTASAELITYKEFHPIAFKQFEPTEKLEFETFNAAVDEFFSKIEAQKQELQTKQQEELATKRVEAIREDHETRIRDLKQVEISSVLQAQAIERNLEKVDKALFIVQSKLAGGMDWRELEMYLNEERKKGDPVASIIVDLKLMENQIVLLLPCELEEEEEESDVSEAESLNSESEQETWQQKKKEHVYLELARIEIDLSLSAFANARRYYDMKRQSCRKYTKTADASEKVSFQIYSSSLYNSQSNSSLITLGTKIGQTKD
jgi:predicted ribosome quality control (RQC) complex YloA/Tae2 family protein